MPAAGGEIVAIRGRPMHPAIMWWSFAVGSKVEAAHATLPIPGEEQMRAGRMPLSAGIVAISIIGAPVGGRATEMLPPSPVPTAQLARPLPKFCAEVFDPVCAKKLGHPRGYPNACFARMDGAADITPGLCSPGQ